MIAFHYVICQECSETHDTENVKFLNIEENEQGKDLMTYECPITKQPTRSLVYKDYV